MDEVKDQQVLQPSMYHVSNTVLLGNVGTHIGTVAQRLVVCVGDPLKTATIGFSSWSRQVKGPFQFF